MAIRKNILILTTSFFITTFSALAAQPNKNSINNLPVQTEKAVPDSVENVSGKEIVMTALQYLGVRYRAGHSSPGGFDCSGFTSYVYKKEHMPISRSSRSQFKQGTPIDEISELKKGDLVFFGGSRSVNRVGHVGIVTDVAPDGSSFEFVHASRTGVRVDSSDSAYYSRRYIGARRILDN